MLNTLLWKGFMRHGIRELVTQQRICVEDFYELGRKMEKNHLRLKDSTFSVLFF